MEHADRSSVAVPWQAHPAPVLERIQQFLPARSAVLGLIDAGRARVDEVLLVSGFSQAAIRSWCERGHGSDALFKTARRRGVAAGTPKGAEHSPLAPTSHVLVAVQPECLADRRWWWLTVSRDGPAFTELEQQLAGTLLRQWQAAFSHTPVRGTGRLIVGHDDRLIHADPFTRETLIRQPDMLAQLLGGLHPIVRQRWADLPEHETRDFAIELAGRPYWVCFHHGRAVSGPDARRWHIETRPLETDELPAVGPVEDPRIARAIVFIHDHYARSPGLAQIAAAASISPFHFHRLFTKQVGVSPKQYLQSKQLQTAKWLLRSTREPIGNIATQAGFASHGHFTSTFHRVVGSSPTEYREAK